MRGVRLGAFSFSATACLLLAAGFLAFPAGRASASSEAAFKKSCAKYKPVDVVSGQHLDTARRTDPTRCLQISGAIQGVMKTDDLTYVILKLVDEATVEIQSASPRDEIAPGARVRCLAKPTGPSWRSRLELLDIVWDQTPVDVLLGAARSALKIPPKDQSGIAASREALRREAASQKSLPTRGADSSLAIRRAISQFNPKLSARELDSISGSVETYCTKYGFCTFDDQMLIVAVIAAESHFNPNARSYKGAAGLGQLMPATAAAHGVNPYDPVQNLDLAIRIIRRNLDKYGGDPLKALAAYNAGTGAVKKHGGVPPYRETRTYLWRIYEYWCQLTGRTPVPRPK
jgi:hypothetical protein